MLRLELPHAASKLHPGRRPRSALARQAVCTQRSWHQAWEGQQQPHRGAPAGPRGRHCWLQSPSKPSAAATASMFSRALEEGCSGLGGRGALAGVGRSAAGQQHPLHLRGHQVQLPGDPIPQWGQRPACRSHNGDAPLVGRPRATLPPSAPLPPPLGAWPHPCLTKPTPRPPRPHPPLGSLHAGSRSSSKKGWVIPSAAVMRRCGE